MHVSPELLAVIGECSKDDQAYKTLLEAVQQAFDAEHARLLEAEQMFRSIAENSPDVIVRYDQDLRHVYVNERIQEINGKPATFFIGKSLQDVYPNAETLTPLDQALLSVFLHAQERRFEFSSTVTGKTKFYECHLIPEFNEHGMVKTVLSVSHDITRRKIAEKTLRNEQRLNRVITNTLRDMITWSDAEGKVLYVNNACEHLLGYTQEELLFTEGYAYIHPEDLNKLLDLADILSTRQLTTSISYRAKHKDGHYIEVETDVHAVLNEVTQQIEGVVSVSRDITERRQMEQKLARSEMHLREAAEARPDAFLLLEAVRDEQNQPIDFRVIYLNRAAEQRFGKTKAEAIGRSIFEIFLPDKINSYFEQYVAVLQTRQTYEQEGVFADGFYSQEWCRRQVIPFGENGIAISRMDITEQKQLEQRLLEQERKNVALQKENELNGLKSRMMVRISHEFRTPISIITTAATSLEKYADKLDADQRAKKLQRIQEQVERITDLLEDITLIVQNYYRQIQIVAIPLDLEALCLEAIESTRLSHNTEHEILLDVQDNTPETWGDPTIIESILGNLLSNAVKYSSTESPIQLSAHRHNGKLHFSVQDKGIGILPEELPQIFSPFFRGSNFDERPGLGLGLSVVKDMVDLYQGDVHVSSQVGQGATFTVTLPNLLPRKN